MAARDERRKAALPGLAVRSPGGRIGWWARRIFPRWSTRIYLRFQELAAARAARERVGSYMKTGSVPLFSHFEIETVNRCNGECDFCPVNRRVDPRRPALMKEALFSRIIGELAGLDYRGYLALYSNNEPLLDRRLPVFAAEARERLPHAFIGLSTNGRLLDVDAFRALLPHLDRLVVNNYHDRPEMHDYVGRIYRFCRTPEGEAAIAGKRVEINLRCVHDVLTTRGGAAPNRTVPARPPGTPCVLPFVQMAVRPGGEVGLCCNDALGQVVLGDLSRETALRVWEGGGFAGVRRAMAERGRAGLPLCRGCDFVKQTVYAERI